MLECVLGVLEVLGVCAGALHVALRMGAKEGHPWHLKKETATRDEDET